MSEEELGVRGWLHKCKYFIIYLVMWLFFSPLGKSFNKGIVLLQQRKWARREMRTHPKSTNGGGNLPSSSVGTYFQRHGNHPYKREDKIWTFRGLWHKPEDGPGTVETCPAGVSQPGLTTVLCVVPAAGMDVITAAGTGSVCGRAVPEAGPGRNQAEMHPSGEHWPSCWLWVYLQCPTFGKRSSVDSRNLPQGDSKSSSRAKNSSWVHAACWMAQKAKAGKSRWRNLMISSTFSFGTGTTQQSRH